MMLEDGLVWVDLEMTGLDPDRDVVIEIATIVTDAHLNVIAEGPGARHPPGRRGAGGDGRVEHAPAWEVGADRSACARAASTRRPAQDLTLEFLRRHVPAGKSPMCGNSICQDRRFMARRMPRLEAFFHYRNLDVSTVKELARRWRPDVLATVSKQGSHLALDDIRDSIAELRHYREHFFRMTP